MIDTLKSTKVPNMTLRKSIGIYSINQDKSTVKEAKELILHAFDKGLIFWRDVPKSLTWEGSGVVYWPYLGREEKG